MADSLTLPFKFVRKFDEYDIAYSPEATRQLKKNFYYTKQAYVYFLGKKFSNRYIYVPKGFFTDGSSTPALFQGILPVWGKHGHAVIAHDRLCETGYCMHVLPNGDVERQKLTRKEIDDVFIEMLDVLEVNDTVVGLVNFAMKVNRGFTRPPVPNVDEIKVSFQERFALANGITNIREEEVVNYIELSA